MNAKRYVLACIATFVFIFVFEFIFHGKLRGGLYKQTASVWHPKADMGSYMGWLTLGQVLFSFIFGYVFLKKHENNGPLEGLRYGILVGALLAPGNLMWYAVLPVPGVLAVAWAGGIIIELALAGMVLAAIYKPVG